MATFKYEVTIKEKPGFKEDGLKKAIINSLKEISGTLIEFQYLPNCDNPNISGTNKCVCKVSAPDLPAASGISAYQYLLGDIQTVEKETYPYFDIISIPTDKMEYKK